VKLPLVASFALLVAGCAGLGLETKEAPGPVEPPSPPQVEAPPLLPPLRPAEVGGASGDIPAGVTHTGGGIGTVTVVPQVERGRKPLGRTWDARAELEAVAEKLSRYLEREPGKLSDFDRLKLLKLKRQALLLLLFTEQFDGEACRRILEVFRRHPQTTLELQGLLFALYQHLGEIQKRNEVFTTLSEALKGTPAFRLEGVCFCEKVVGYRAVVPVVKAVFPPGRTVTIYGEFEGAAVRSLTGGAREQQIQIYLTVLDSNGTVIDTVEFLSRRDGTRRLSPGETASTRSYFVGSYTLAQTLKPGKYQLRLTATDLVGHKESHADLQFEVIPGPSLK